MAGKRTTKPSNGIVPYTPTESKALQRVFDSVPQQEIVSALIDSGDPRAISLAERLSDDAYSRTQLAKHCFELKLLPKDVWAILIDARKLEARVKLSAALTEIVTSVAEMAVPQIMDCPRCKGAGEVPPKKKGDPPSTCSTCHGMGQIVREADKESQKMALEMGEMLNQKVPLIAQQFNSYGKGGSGEGLGVPDMTDWTRQSDSIFEEHRGAVIDAEIVDDKR